MSTKLSFVLALALCIEGCASEFDERGDSNRASPDREMLPTEPVAFDLNTASEPARVTVPPPGANGARRVVYIDIANGGGGTYPYGVKFSDDTMHRVSIKDWKEAPYYRPDVDVVVNLGGGSLLPITLSKPLIVMGGRRVYVRGNYVKASFSRNAMITFDSPRAFAAVEGVKIDGDGRIIDGIALRNRPQVEYANKYYGGFDFYLISRLNTVAPFHVIKSQIVGINGDHGFHGDMVQAQMGRIRRVFVDNFSGTTAYQGFMLADRPEKVLVNGILVPNYHLRILTKQGVFTGKYTDSVEVHEFAKFSNVSLSQAICPQCSASYLGFYLFDNPVAGAYMQQRYSVHFDNVKMTETGTHPVASMIVPNPKAINPGCDPLYIERELRMPGTASCKLFGKIDIVN